jgi:hypothetical protein
MTTYRPLIFDGAEEVSCAAGAAGRANGEAGLTALPSTGHRDAAAHLAGAPIPSGRGSRAPE